MGRARPAIRVRLPQGRRRATSPCIECVGRGTKEQGKRLAAARRGDAEEILVAAEGRQVVRLTGS